MEVGRRRKRRNARPLYEPLYDFTKIEREIKECEWGRLESMHLAAQRSERGWRYYVHPHLHDFNFRWYQSEVLESNLGLNDCYKEWDKASKRHALVAVTYLSRYHPVFSKLDVCTCKVFCLIYGFASMPSYPDTGPAPTLEQLWCWLPHQYQIAKRTLVVDYYDRILPGFKF